jgi:hypothetical protein
VKDLAQVFESALAVARVRLFVEVVVKNLCHLRVCDRRRAGPPSRFPVRPRGRGGSVASPAGPTASASETPFSHVLRSLPAHQAGAEPRIHRAARRGLRRAIRQCSASVRGSGARRLTERD